MTKKEMAALSVDPWGDGKGDDYYRVFRNLIVTTKKPAICGLCFASISVGSRVRAQTEQSNDYGVRTFKFCPTCVDAMGEYGLNDNIEPLEECYRRGMAGK